MNDFSAREVTWASHGPALTEIRRIVFVEEQDVPEHVEWDGEDPHCRHFLAEDGHGRPIGTARLMPSGQIGRMAVLIAWRGRGVGARLLKLAVTAAQSDDYDRVYLHAQIQAIGFYERAGFEATGPPFLDAGIEHRAMVLPPA